MHMFPLFLFYSSIQFDTILLVSLNTSFIFSCCMVSACYTVLHEDQSKYMVFVPTFSFVNIKIM